MDCMIIVPRGIPGNILGEANLYGAQIAVVERELRFQALEIAAENLEWFPVGLFLPRRVQNAFGVEGYRSFAYEIVDELGEAPEAILFPCARGNGLYGAYKGFLDCREAGWITRLPRMIATQPNGANSLEISVSRHTSEAVELPPFDSIARSTSETVGSDDALRAIRDTGGTALSADDKEIRAAVLALGEEGFNVEAGAALPIACLPKLRDAGALGRDGAVVCVLTATGLRWPEQAGWVRPRIFEVEDTATFARLLDAR
jgi:threonine synthase